MSQYANGMARFAHRIGQLKSVPRAGWLHRGVSPERTESVSDHSFRVAVLAWLVSADEEGLDRERVIKLALLHDLPEAITGDLTPYDPALLLDRDAGSRRETLNARQVPSAERKAAKKTAEAVAIADLIAGLGPVQRDEITELWTELQTRETPESQFVKEIDVLETYLQSREYLAQDAALPMDSFAAEVAEVIKSPSMTALRDALTTMSMEFPGDRRSR